MCVWYGVLFHGTFICVIELVLVSRICGVSESKTSRFK